MASIFMRIDGTTPKGAATVEKSGVKMDSLHLIAFLGVQYVVLVSM